MSPSPDALPRALSAVLAELDQATGRLDALAGPLDEASWSRRPPGGGWSVAQCIEHLNVTTERFLPLIDEALQRATAEGLIGADRFSVDVMGRVLLWVIEPPYRVRARTPSPFDPADAAPRVPTCDRFRALQAALRERIEGSGGLQVSRVKVVSPFDARVRYSVYTAYRIIPCHQRRHLWQAERVLTADR